MHLLWETLILPLLDAASCRRLVEIGVEQGRNTRKLLEYCRKVGGFLHAIDPHPHVSASTLDPDGKTLRFHRARSIDALPIIEEYDAVLIDGDHNWYTVSRELELIALHSKETGGAARVFVPHMTGPDARRAVYSAPPRVPAPTHSR